MSAIDDVIIRIRAIGGKEAAAEVGETEAGLKEMGSTAKTVAGLAGIGAVAFGLRDVTRAAITFQNQQALTANALKNTGQYSAENVNRLMDAADRMSESGGYDPTTTIAGMQQLLRAHESVGESIKNETLVTDIARASHLSYNTALRLVLQTETGRITSLARLGLNAHTTTKYADELTASTKHATIAQRDHAKALDYAADRQKGMTELWKYAGGAMKNYSNTAQGASENFSHSIDILGQRVGTFLLPVISAFVRELSKAAKWLNDNQTAVKILVGAFGALGAVWGIEKIASFVGWLSKSVVVTKAMTAAQWLYNAAWAAFDFLTDLVAAGLAAVDLEFLPIEVSMGLVVLALAALAFAIYELVTHWKTVKRVAIDVFDAVKNAVMTFVNWFREHWKLIIAIMLPVLGAVIDIVVTHFSAIKHFIGTVIDWFANRFRWAGNQIKGIFEFVKNDVVMPVFNWIAGRAEWAAKQTVKFWHSIRGPFVAVWHFIKKEAGDVLDWFVNRVKWAVGQIKHMWNTITGPFKAIGHALGGAASSVGHFLGINGGAQGGRIQQSGLYEVGENGRELVALPAGASVIPNGFAENGNSSQTGFPLEAQIVFQVGPNTFAKGMARATAYAKATS